jgi:hypothetical protein
MGVLIEADVIEDEELGFRSEERGIGGTAILQVQFGFLGNPAGIALVILFGDGIPGISDDNQRGHFRERIHEDGIWIGDEEHIALIDGSPTADTRSVHAETVLERIDLQLADGVGNVMLKARYVSEADVDLASIVFLGEI